MSLPLVRRSEAWKFAYAAPAMGAFWARARKAWPVPSAAPRRLKGSTVPHPPRAQRAR